VVYIEGGGSGFIGGALTNALKTKGYNVKIVSRKPGPINMTWVSRSVGICDYCNLQYLVIRAEEVNFEDID
jgi:nucleoside-diphosphate-sugar epimerase